MKIGYMRVSTTEQNLARQEQILNEYGVEKIFSDKSTGANTDREGFKNMLEFVRQGDVLVVSELSRLSRSVQDLLKTVEILNAKNVDIVFIKEQIDSTTSNGRLVMTIFAALAQWERELIKERQAEGIAIAKQQGKFKGRQCKKFDEAVLQEVLELLKTKSCTVTEASKKLGVTRQTVYNIIRRYNDSN